jgi:hypothetical protein
MKTIKCGASSRLRSIAEGTLGHQVAFVVMPEGRGKLPTPSQFIAAVKATTGTSIAEAISVIEQGALRRANDVHFCTLFFC